MIHIFEDIGHMIQNVKAVPIGDGYIAHRSLDNCHVSISDSKKFGITNLASPQWYDIYTFHKNL
jgi:hypothetical protein